MNEEHVAAGGRDFLDQIEDIFALFFENSIDGCVIVDDDVALHVRLRGGELELDQADFGVLDLAGAACEVRNLLVDEDEAVDEL